MSTTPSFHELCTLCRGIFSQINTIPESADGTDWKYHSIQGLIVSAGQGCHFCSLILGRVNVETVDDIQTRELDLTRLWSDHTLSLNMDAMPWDLPTVEIRLHSDRVQDRESEVDPSLKNLLNGHLVLKPSGRVSWSSVLAESPQRPMLKAKEADITTVINMAKFPSTLNKDCIKIIQDWIRICDTSHSRCTERLSSRKRLPKRLLDVSCYLEQSTGVCLVNTKELPDNIHYVTLSHRWNNSLTTKLLRSNKTTFYENILISELPKTFTDALSLTRNLGITYLWIDSLCIIQDCEEDKAEQIMLMGDIYTNSTLNLAAISASNGFGGLDYPRNPLEVVPCIILPGQKGARNEELVCYDENAWQSLVDASALNRRGWVVQERLLAPRAVSFAADQIYWECASLHASECFPLGLPVGGTDFVAQMKDLQLLRPSAKDTGDKLEEFMRIWTQILRIYAKSEFTYESDRFNAIWGVVSQLASNFGLDKHSDYIAGLWRPHLDFQLLWSAETIRGRRNSGGRRKSDETPLWSWTLNDVHKSLPAPSWSWASYQGSIDYEHFEPEAVSLISIIGLGDADDGYDMLSLRVQGHLCSVSSILLARKDAPRASAERESVRKQPDDVRRDITSENDGHPSADIEAAASRFILLVRRTGHLYVEDRTISCLILELTGQKRGQYRRVGFTSIGRYDGDTAFSYDEAAESGNVDCEVSASMLLHLCETLELPEACFESFDEEKGYVIEII